MELYFENSTLVGVCRFLASFPESVFENGKRTDKQEINDEGVPLWAVKVQLVQSIEKDNLDRDFLDDEIFVSVPCVKDPAEGLRKKEQIAFADFVVFSDKRRGSSGRWEKFKASNIVRKKAR